MNREKLELLIKRLELEAENYEALDEEFNAYEGFGGNTEDAFWVGCEHGSAEFACELLQFLKGE
jgi:hypothetical protein